MLNKYFESIFLSQLKYRKFYLIPMILMFFCGPYLTYFYTEKGVKFESEPTGAIVQIKIDVIAPDGHITESTNKSDFITTPAYYPEDQFIRYSMTGDIKLRLQYTITVSKPGYRTIIQHFEGDSMKTCFHWVLEPLPKNSNQPNRDQNIFK